MTTVADALEYLEAGWSVIPIRDGAKVPAVRSWEPWQSARPDAAKIRKWFRESGRHNIAVILGPVSGDLICRDFDKLESYEAWAAEHRELAKSLPTVETSKGRHVYCRGDFGAIGSDEDTVERLLQVNRGVAHRWLMLFQIDGLLLLVEKGSQQSRRASRYHYRGTM